MIDVVGDIGGWRNSRSNLIGRVGYIGGSLVHIYMIMIKTGLGGLRWELGSVASFCVYFLSLD